MAPVIQAEGLFKRYPGFAPVLRGASISVESGEMVAIMGPSGCGKSTMLHILGMLHAPDSGSLEILGVNVLDLSREETAAFRRGNMGFVMQASNLFEHSTVFENVEFPLIYENVPPQERWERVIRALDLVRLSARVHYPSNRLSGGEQQRVAIARAMVNNPRILLADEPTGALDARTSRLIMENFRTLCHSGGVSMVMVTHDPKMAEYCDTVYTLDEGLLNCKKRGVAPFTVKSGDNFLKAPVPAVFGSLITSYFPDSGDRDLLELARRLYAREMLARIYAIFHHGLWEDNSDYALPLAVRHMGFWSRVTSCFFGRRQGPLSLRKLWKQLPARPGGLWGRIGAFGAGALLARWGEQDAIQFFYAVGARTPATAAWVGSYLLRVPFAFEIRPGDLGHFEPDWKLKANTASFIVCSTRSLLNEVKKLLPDIPAGKFLLVPQPPVVTPAEDEADAISSTTERKVLEILTMGPDVSEKGYETAVLACGILKKAKVEFRLSVYATSTLKYRRLIRKLDLTKEIAYLGKPSLENMGESYKIANIFIAFPPAGAGSDLSLPLYVREAMAYGLAIATAGMTLGMGEALKNGENCLECAFADASELADNLKRLADDGSLRAKLAENARRDLEKLVNAEANSQMLADLMAQAVGESAQEGASGHKIADRDA